MNVAGRLVVIAIVFGSASSALAQSASCRSADFNVFYDCVRQRTIETRREQRSEIENATKRAAERWGRKAREIARSSQVPVRAPSLSTANVATAAELAQAAISTSVNGADAGISLSPLALLGYQDNAVQLPLTFAALKDGVTRLQLGVTVQLNDEPRVMVAGCAQDDTALLSLIEDQRVVYADVCQGIKALVPAKPVDATLAAERDKSITMIRSACGLEGDSPGTVSTGVIEIVNGVKALKVIYVSLARTDASMIASRDAVERLFVRGVRDLASYKEPAPDDCENESSKALGDAAVRAAWELARTRIGVSVRGDLFRRQFGFNPDHSKPLEDGRLKDGELRIEASYARCGVEFVAGIGYGRARPTLSDDLTGYISPSLSFAWTVAGLSADPLYGKDGEINVVDGALPPRLVLGVDAQLQYAPSPPSTQVVKLQEFAVTAFADFRFTEKVTARIGIPITADLKVRPADPMAERKAKQDRQWAIPVFVATVIKL